MDMSQNSSNCVYNLMRTQFNEIMGHDEFFSYDLQYPSFFTMNNDYFYIMPTYLDNINSTIKLDVDTFIKGLRNEEREYNLTAVQNNETQRNFRASSSFAVTFSKNHILSVIVNLIGEIEGVGNLYNLLYNYNYDLLTGNIIQLGDVFKSDVDHIDVVTNYVNYKINQNPSIYNPTGQIEIPEDQAFYLTEDGIVIYFGADEFASAQYEIPKFKMMFSKFEPYINYRFYCTEPETPGPIPRPKNRLYKRF